MATSPGTKGNPLYANSDDMDGPAQMSAISAWAAAHIGEQEDTVAGLPSTGNWAGRHIYVTGVGDHVWDGTGWYVLSGTGLWVSLEAAPGYRLDTVAPARIALTGRQVTLSGVILPSSGNFPTTSNGIFPFKALDSAYWPSQVERVSVAGQNGSASGLAIIDMSGGIELRTNGTAASYIALEGGYRI